MLTATLALLNSVIRRRWVVGAGVLLGGALAGSCTKEYGEIGPDQLPLLTGVEKATDTTYTRWRITARRSTYDGQEYDLFAIGDPCRHDDFREFRPDTTLFWQPGRTPCPPAEGDTVWGHWEVSEGLQALRLRNDPGLPREEYTIRELTEQQMVLFWSGKTLTGGIQTETVTLTGAER